MILVLAEAVRNTKTATDGMHKAKL
jgi:hypothetical protein